MNAKCNLVTVLLLCCLIFPGNAQEFNWQDLVNRKQYAAVIAHADSLTLADSSNYEIMNAIGQAYEGMLRYQKAYDYYRLCFSMDMTNLDILNILARTATNLGRAEDAERYFHQVLSAIARTSTLIISWHVCISNWGSMRKQLMPMRNCKLRMRIILSYTVRLAIAILEWNNILLLRPLIFRRIT